MPRIVVAQCIQEVSTFNPIQSVYDDFIVHHGFWARRDRMQPDLIDLERAILEARRVDGPVIFTDAADAPSSIVVKSPHCQAQFFDAWAAKNYNVDVPGSTSANLKTLGHTICHRPMYPLDEDVSFVQKARVFGPRG